MELDAITAEVPAEAESAHTSSRKSARNARIELITRGERRRRWTIEQKQTIAAQSLAPGASSTEVARQYGISSGQLYTWRHALLAAQPAAVTHTAGRFARVEVKATRTVEHVCQKAALEASSAVPQLLADPTAQLSGRIEIVLTDGTAVRMDAQVDEVALRRVLAVLRG
ncbi:MAG: transposase [Acetobacteraceae bacterium]|jgi:transposase